MKKRIIRTFSCLLIAVLALTCLCSCSPVKMLCGKWEFSEYEPADYPSTDKPFNSIEFFDDVTYEADEAGFHGDFKAQGKVLNLDVNLKEYWVAHGVDAKGDNIVLPQGYMFKIHGDTLIINDHFIYKKVG